MPQIGVNTLWHLTFRADRNKNGILDAYDGNVLGKAETRVKEAAETVSRGEAAIDGIRLAPEDAGVIAGMLTAGAEFLDRAFVSDAARSAIDGAGGGEFDDRVSRKELIAALQWGAIAATHDGLVLSQEARAQFGHAPAVPLNPKVPVAPGIPVKPAIPELPAMPTPPVKPVSPPATANPSGFWPLDLTVKKYLENRETLIKSGQAPNSAAYKEYERKLINWALAQIWGAANPSFAERRSALSKVYQYSSLTFDQYRNLVKQLPGYTEAEVAKPVLPFHASLRNE